MTAVALHPKPPQWTQPIHKPTSPAHLYFIYQSINIQLSLCSFTSASIITMNRPMPPPPPPKHLTLHRLTTSGSPMEQDFWKVYEASLNPSYHLTASINRRLRNLEANQSIIIHAQNLREAHSLRLQKELLEANTRINMLQTSLFNIKSKLQEEITDVQTSEKSLATTIQSVSKEVQNVHQQLTLNQLLNSSPGPSFKVGSCKVTQVQIPHTHQLKIPQTIQPKLHQPLVSSAPPSPRPVAQPPKKRVHIME